MKKNKLFYFIAICIAFIFLFSTSAFASFEEEIEEELSWEIEEPAFLVEGDEHSDYIETEIIFDDKEIVEEDLQDDENQLRDGSGTDGIVLNADVITVSTTRTVQLIPTITGGNPNTSVIWLSTDPTIATVDADGTVHGVKYGKTKITAYADGQAAQCTVRVRYGDADNTSAAYFRPVYWMAWNALTGGYNGNSEFRPATECSRGQYCAFLYKLNGSPSIGSVTNPFSDINSSTTHYTAIMWAYSNGIVGGYSDGTFRPTNTCTRASAILMLWRFAGSPNVSITSLPFSDIGNLSNAYKKAIVWCYNHSIVGGYPDGTFKPYEDFLRKHAAIVLYKYSRIGCQYWQCLGCDQVYYNEPDAETHYLSIDPTIHFVYGSSRTFVSHYYPFNVPNSIELINFYFGIIPWDA